MVAPSRNDALRRNMSRRRTPFYVAAVTVVSLVLPVGAGLGPGTAGAGATSAHRSAVMRPLTKKKPGPSPKELKKAEKDVEKILKNSAEARKLLKEWQKAVEKDLKHKKKIVAIVCNDFESDAGPLTDKLQHSPPAEAKSLTSDISFAAAAAAEALKEAGFGPTMDLRDTIEMLDLHMFDASSPKEVNKIMNSVYVECTPYVS